MLRSLQLNIWTGHQAQMHRFTPMSNHEMNVTQSYRGNSFWIVFVKCGLAKSSEMSWSSLMEQMWLMHGSWVCICQVHYVRIDMSVQGAISPCSKQTSDFILHAWLSEVRYFVCGAVRILQRTILVLCGPAVQSCLLNSKRQNPIESCWASHIKRARADKLRRHQLKTSSWRSELAAIDQSHECYCNWHLSTISGPGQNWHVTLAEDIV